MSSRRSVRQVLVAVLLGVLVGGGLMAVTPAGAQVSTAVATNWKKIWKKNLKPLADKRYYTKAQSDAKYQPKGSYETAGSGYSKAESDAKYSAAGSSYSKAEGDAKYQSKTQLIRGTVLLADTAAAAGGFLTESLSFGVTLSAAPTPHFIAAGDPLPAGCLGTAAAPDAQPGHLCVFETIRTNVTGNPGIYASTGGPGTSTMGALMTVFSTAAGTAYVAGTWAVRPAAVSNARTNPAPTSAGTLGVTP
jgi:hypothetical protein